MFDLPTEFSGSNRTPIYPSVGISLAESKPLLMVGGAEGVINVAMVSGGLARAVEASGAWGKPEGVSGDTSPLGVVDMVGGSN